jgi:hypothetical protein
MLKHFKTYGFPDTDKKSDFEISENVWCYNRVVKVIGIITDGDIRRMLNEKILLQN